MRVSALDTPAVLIDIDRAEANIARAQAYADHHRLKLRPHIKTHKLPLLAHRQVDAGAVGITCQKLGEAEVMADAGLHDILLPYNLLGQAKLERLQALARRIRLSVTADSPETVAGYAEAFPDRGKVLPVLVECDTGMGRCGVQAPQDALALARQIDHEPGLAFSGLMTYPAAGQAARAADWLAEARDLLNRSGLPADCISSGGTPDLWRAHEAAHVITEYRPGTYIYLDRYQVAKEVGSFDDCALSVIATVVSRPTVCRAVIDAGSKALTSDTLGLEGFGSVVDLPEAVIQGLSEEHGHLDVAACRDKPRIGDRLRIVPNHACVVSNLFDSVVLVSGDTVLERIPVAARGRVD